MQQLASAQLVTHFEPGIAPAPETTIDRALMQWSSLGETDRQDALLIVQEVDGGRHVYGRAAIARMVVR